MSLFRSHLLVRELDDARALLLAPLVYESDVLGQTITVPKGFITDYSSVPRIPIVYWLFGGRAKRPAVVHDYLYAMQTTTRRLADAVFYEACGVDGRRVTQRWPMWAGVRLGGWWAWRNDDPERRVA